MFFFHSNCCVTFTLRIFSCMHSKQIYSFDFSMLSVMPCLLFNYFLSVEFWPKGLLKMCEHRLSVSVRMFSAYDVLQISVLHNNVQI